MRVDPIITDQLATLGQIIRGLDNGISIQDNMVPEGIHGQVIVSNGSSSPPSYQGGVGDLPYGINIIPDMKFCTRCKIEVTDGVGFNIDQPVNSTPATILIFDIVNRSGGVMGSITWHPVYKLSGGSVSNPSLNTRLVIGFYWNLIDFVEVFRSQDVDV